ncbi:hypothetical protein ACSAZK_02885 [Methanosarcina sp. Mfa9]|uniref:hypothetical protein n=1 Tax=Methanosarcina sp. Mfa9 TaxID=3439063 RepID=UPI003F82CAD0
MISNPGPENEKSKFKDVSVSPLSELRFRPITPVGGLEALIADGAIEPPVAKVIALAVPAVMVNRRAVNNIVRNRDRCLKVIRSVFCIFIFSP